MCCVMSVIQNYVFPSSGIAGLCARRPQGQTQFNSDKGPYCSSFTIVPPSGQNKELIELIALKVTL